MQLVNVTPLNAKNPILVYGVEAKSKKSVMPKAKAKAKTVKAEPKKSIKEAGLNCQIEMCAYYKAEARGFEPGCEMEDWLAAEAEIKNGCR